MKTWNQLFVRCGWVLVEKEKDVFACKNETEVNLQFLFQSLDKANIRYHFNKGVLTILSSIISEDQWLETVDYDYRGRGEGLWFDSSKEQPKIHELDLFISGIVRQVNRLGYETLGSCDGHGRRAAHVMISKEKKIEELVELLLAFGCKSVNWREHRNSYHLSLHLKQHELLDLAENMSLVEESWLEQGYEFIKQQRFYHLLEQLLNIPGVSGNEERVRKFVIEKLTPYVDHISVDRAGNVLAEKIYRGGHGPVILFNAHLDTVYEIEPGRKIVKNGNTWSSSKGILGADDRAGIAVLLHTAEYLSQHSSFSGKVKFIFTVEEECGLVGAREVDEYFLWGTDAAIVVDRRGTGDIVTSCGGYFPFCHPQYGAFFEEIAVIEGLNGWATTKGGSSDTRIWAEHSIESVNLSAGYRNEHTEEEILDVEACYGTAQLLEEVLRNDKKLRAVLRGIKREQFADTILKTAL
ncbi:M20/M25/M40 family metallo-hydrolase [Alkalihalobacterium alkalinitrilicum]|uniref:M20/M25/M40 family metallo-hydrolase n=1 Tax=Alkalihalobacterium alkalinitrilicum TaxID=427920 RepID=UPI00099582B7|nr:M20/M25/M40 family metallo-hydrolase [Alkalihalobacterium alkalinitrilicum]